MTMITLRSRALIATAAAVALTVCGALPAAAETNTAQSSENLDAQISFAVFDGASFDEVVESMLVNNDADAVVQFLESGTGPESRLAEASAHSLALLGLGGLTDAEVQSQMNAAAQSVRSGEQFVLDSGTVSLMDIDTAPVFGEKRNASHSWYTEDRVEYITCPFPWACGLNSWLDYRFMTGPGRLGTKTDLIFDEGGNGLINAVTLETIVYANGSEISHMERDWNTPGVATQWNTPHSDTTNKRFQIWYKLDVHMPNGATITAEWKSARTTPCDEPQPGAFRCLFP